MPGRQIILVAALLFAGCAYGRDRLLDLTDMVDLSYGAGGIGLGAKVRATEFLTTGLGAGNGYRSEEWYGRRIVSYKKSNFLGLLVLGWDGGGGLQLNNPPHEVNFLVFRSMKPFPPPVSWWKFGGEVILPGVRFGAYVNVGEILDFILGFTTLDIADDDGLMKGEKQLRHWPSRSGSRDSKGHSH
jgi:hypothetical protein